MHINYEFKAKCTDIARIEALLSQLQARFIGEDHQTDTYFNIPDGRLKLREGNIENALIYYKRNDTAGAKQSDILLYQHGPDKTLKEILITALGIKVAVVKKRKIYFIGNVKFHLDDVSGLGTFVEVEAIDKEGNMGMEQLTRQCSYYAGLLHILPTDYIAVSYSDLLLQQAHSANTFQTT